MLKEFKEFAIKGNALELAVGVIIGGAFQSIVKSLVDDIIMPLISLLIGNVDFAEWTWQIGNATIHYGSFISAIVNFLLIAFSLFLVVKYLNRLNNKIEEAKLQEAQKLEDLKKKSKFLKKVSKKEPTEKVSNKNTEKAVEKTTKVAEVTTKLCPYCFSEINIKATKCPHCTSNLKEEE